MNKESFLKKHPVIKGFLLCIVLIFVLLFLLAIFLPEVPEEIEGYITVTGVDQTYGDCVVPEINIWRYPEEISNNNQPVSKISNACPQVRLPYYEKNTAVSRVWFKVSTNDIFGWVSDSFVIDQQVV